MMTIATVNHAAGMVMAKHIIDWPGLAHMVTTHIINDSKNGPGWMPAAIEPGPRKQERVAHWSCLVLDVEAHAENQPNGLKRVTGPLPPSLSEIATELELRGWDAALASSHSHEGPAENGTLGPRYRVALHTSRPIKPAEIQPLAQHVADKLGLSDCVDTSCMEAARLFYLPRVPEARLTLVQSAVVEGYAIPVDDLLAEVQRVSTSVRRPAGGEADSVIDAFNRQADIGTVIEAHGYEQKGRYRWKWPGSTTGLAGVVLVPRTSRLYSHHPNDPQYCKEHAHDAFSAWCILEHNGSVTKAVKAAAQLLGRLPRTAPSLNLANLNGRGSVSQSAPSTLLESKSQAVIAIPPAFAFVPVSDLLAEPKPVKYLIDELMESQSLALLFAAPSSGKSFLAISWAASVATGSPWMGHAVESGPVFYLAGEGHAGLARRLRAWEIHHGEVLTNAPLFVSKTPAALMDAQSAANVVGAIKVLACNHGQPALIILDTFARNMGSGDENSNSDIGIFVNHIDQMRAELGCAVLLVHHTGHMDKDRARGGSALNAAMDTSFQLEKKVGQSIELTHRKSKESELFKPIHLELVEVALPGWLDGKGRQMASAVLIPKSACQPEVEPHKPLTASQQQGMQAFLEAERQCSRPLDPETPIQIHVDQWRAAFYSVSSAENPEAKKMAFQRVRRDLVHLKLLGVVEDSYLRLAPTLNLG